MSFFKCKHCGQVIAIVKRTGVPVVCCGDEMNELIANTSDGAFEKHVPVYEQKDGKVVVKVGSVAHPMVEAHHIEWVAVQTADGMMFKKLAPGALPEAEFQCSEKVEAVYAYCNLHGLYKA